MRCTQKADSGELLSFAVVLTYHAIEDGPLPLCIPPKLFGEHLDAIGDSGARVVTVTELASILRTGEVDRPAVAITFDDGFASVPSHAAPLLAERGFGATMFCVAGHLGRTNDWPSGRAGGFRAPLATASQIAQLAASGIEIGSHGMDHAPLVDGSEDVLTRELVESKLALEHVTGAGVTSYAYPYGAKASGAARSLLARTYSAACAATIDVIDDPVDLLMLPRIDAHYLRRPALLRKALGGELRGYLRLRRMGARIRRVAVADYHAEYGFEQLDPGQ